MDGPQFTAASDGPLPSMNTPTRDANRPFSIAFTRTDADFMVIHPSSPRSASKCYIMLDGHFFVGRM